MIKKVLVGTVMCSIVSMSLYGATINNSIYNAAIKNSEFMREIQSYENISTLLGKINSLGDKKINLTLGGDNNKVLANGKDWTTRDGKVNLGESYKVFSTILSLAAKRVVYENFGHKIIDQKELQGILKNNPTPGVQNSIYCFLALDEDFSANEVEDNLGSQKEHIKQRLNKYGVTNPNDQRLEDVAIYLYGNGFSMQKIFSKSKNSLDAVQNECMQRIEKIEKKEAEKAAKEEKERIAEQKRREDEEKKRKEEEDKKKKEDEEKRKEEARNELIANMILNNNENKEKEIERKKQEEENKKKRIKEERASVFKEVEAGIKAIESNENILTESEKELNEIKAKYEEGKNNFIKASNDCINTETKSKEKTVQLKVDGIDKIKNLWDANKIADEIKNENCQGAAVYIAFRIALENAEQEYKKAAEEYRTNITNLNSKKSNFINYRKGIVDQIESLKGINTGINKQTLLAKIEKLKKEQEPWEDSENEKYKNLVSKIDSVVDIVEENKSFLDKKKKIIEDISKESETETAIQKYDNLLEECRSQVQKIKDCFLGENEKGAKLDLFAKLDNKFAEFNEKISNKVLGVSSCTVKTMFVADEVKDKFGDTIPGIREINTHLVFVDNFKTISCNELRCMAAQLTGKVLARKSKIEKDELNKMISFTKTGLCKFKMISGFLNNSDEEVSLQIKFREDAKEFLFCLQIENGKDCELYSGDASSADVVNYIYNLIGTNIVSDKSSRDALNFIMSGLLNATNGQKLNDLLQDKRLQNFIEDIISNREVLLKCDDIKNENVRAEYLADLKKLAKFAWEWNCRDITEYLQVRKDFYRNKINNLLACNYDFVKYLEIEQILKEKGLNEYPILSQFIIEKIYSDLKETFGDGSVDNISPEQKVARLKFFAAPVFLNIGTGGVEIEQDAKLGLGVKKQNNKGIYTGRQLVFSEIEKHIDYLTNVCGKTEEDCKALINGYDDNLNTSCEMLYSLKEKQYCKGMEKVIGDKSCYKYNKREISNYSDLFFHTPLIITGLHLALDNCTSNISKVFDDKNKIYIYKVFNDKMWMAILNNSQCEFSDDYIALDRILCNYSNSNNLFEIKNNLQQKVEFVYWIYTAKGCANLQPLLCNELHSNINTDENYKIYNIANDVFYYYAYIVNILPNLRRKVKFFWGEIGKSLNDKAVLKYLLAKYEQSLEEKCKSLERSSRVLFEMGKASDEAAIQNEYNRLIEEEKKLNSLSFEEKQAYEKACNEYENKRQEYLKTYDNKENIIHLSKSGTIDSCFKAKILGVYDKENLDNLVKDKNYIDGILKFVTAMYSDENHRENINSFIKFLGLDKEAIEAKQREADKLDEIGKETIDVSKKYQKLNELLPGKLDVIISNCVNSCKEKDDKNENKIYAILELLEKAVVGNTLTGNVIANSCGNGNNEQFKTDLVKFFENNKDDPSEKIYKDFCDELKRKDPRLFKGAELFKDEVIVKKEQKNNNESAESKKITFKKIGDMVSDMYNSFYNGFSRKPDAIYSDKKLSKSEEDKFFGTYLFTNKDKNDKNAINACLLLFFKTAIEKIEEKAVTDKKLLTKKFYEDELISVLLDATDSVYDRNMVSGVEEPKNLQQKKGRLCDILRVDVIMSAVNKAKDEGKTEVDLSELEKNVEKVVNEIITSKEINSLFEAPKSGNNMGTTQKDMNTPEAGK